MNIVAESALKLMLNWSSLVFSAFFPSHNSGVVARHEWEVLF